mgnify:CR=1 FL=1
MDSHTTSTNTRDAVRLGVFVSCALIVLIFFKYLPDVGTSVIQSLPSTLMSWDAYTEYYLSEASVHHARFLGNELVHWLARLLPEGPAANDVRLHPLRLSATLFTILWFLVALIPMAMPMRRFDPRIYLAGLSVMVMSGLYVYYPCDAPSLAWLALGTTFLLSERLMLALACLLITGLFRESAFHLVVMTGLWALCARHQTLAKRVAWPLAFGALFAVEYKLIRHWYPGAVKDMGHYAGLLSAEGLSDLVLGGGLWSLTTLLTLPLAVAYPLAWWRFKRHAAQHEWQHRFFLLNCLAFPAWVFFYRTQGGNINEFRIMWPFLLPCLMGLAWQPSNNSSISASGHSKAH